MLDHASMQAVDPIGSCNRQIQHNQCMGHGIAVVSATLLIMCYLAGVHQLQEG